MMHKMVVSVSCDGMLLYEFECTAAGGGADVVSSALDSARAWKAHGDAFMAAKSVPGLDVALVKSIIDALLRIEGNIERSVAR